MTSSPLHGTHHHPSPQPGSIPTPVPIPNPIFDEPVFNEGSLIPDPSGFHIPHPSDNATYQKINDLLLTQTTPIPPSRVTPDAVVGLAEIFGDKGADVVKAIEAAGAIVFHAVGDTGSSAVGTYPSEIKTADRMFSDFTTAATNRRPSFFYHLGDVVYNFGESKYYYDEFYDPYRNYPRPIIAIPGNHDSFILSGTKAGQTPLEIFKRNFCALHPAVTSEAYSLHRTAQTLPGVYFTLDAPFVRIIGLFSNALEDPGVISTQGGRWPNVTDVQLDFLRAQLTLIKTQAYPGAVVIALHHPPFTYLDRNATGSSAIHGSSTDALRDIDTICAQVGIYPHAFLSGHAHNYQRYTRKLTFEGQHIEIPYVVCGSGGHHINPLVKSPFVRPTFGSDVSYMEKDPAVVSNGLTLEKYDDQNFGYLLVTVDSSKLRIAFNNTASSSPQQSRFDLVTIDVQKHARIAN